MLFTRSKKKRKTEQQTFTPINVPTWEYRSFNGDIFTIELFVASIDALARNIAKIELRSIRSREDEVSITDRTSDVAKVLKKPNPYMTSYDFLYKIAALYYATGNVFIWPEYDGEKLAALWPVNYSNFHLIKNPDGISYTANFQLNYFQSYYVPYNNLIHLRNHYFNDDLMGDVNHTETLCELLNAQDQGIINGIKNSAIIRGILKAAGVIKEDDMDRERKRFVKDNLSAANNGGVIFIDSKFDYQDLQSKPYVIDAETMDAAKKKVFDYLGVNEDFLTNNFTSEKYESVYEGRIQPFAIMLTQAMTAKLFSEREQSFGAEIEASMSKVKYQPTSTMVEVINATKELGLFTRDEFREMLGYAPLGEERGGNDIMIAANNYEAEGEEDYDETGEKFDDEGQEEDPDDEEEALFDDMADQLDSLIDEMNQYMEDLE